ncbi:MAG: hypothetical protein U0T81_10910 [Saprospiraceae bacterium]
MVPDEIVYMGDDLPGSECLQYVGLASAPPMQSPKSFLREYVATLREGRVVYEN